MYSRCIFSGLAGWVAIVFALVLSGCAYEGGTVAVAKDAAPPHDADLIKFLEALPDPVVKAESRSQRGNGPVYEVWGQAYRVMESATDFWQEPLGTARNFMAERLPVANAMIFIN